MSQMSSPCPNLVYDIFCKAAEFQLTHCQSQQPSPMERLRKCSLRHGASTQIPFLYANDELPERHMKKGIPFKIATKNQVCRTKFNLNPYNLFLYLDFYSIQIYFYGEYHLSLESPTIPSFEGKKALNHFKIFIYLFLWIWKVERQR